MQNPLPNDSGFTEISNLQKTVKELSAAIEKTPGDAAAYYQRGVIYGQLVEPLAAIRDFDKVVRLDPTNAEAYYNRGLAYIHLKEQMPAVEDFSHAIRLNPDHIDAYNNRAAALYDLGKPRQALQDIDKAITLNDQVPSAYAIRALAHTHLGEDDAAEKKRSSGRRAGLRRLHAPPLHPHSQEAAPLPKQLGHTQLSPVCRVECRPSLLFLCVQRDCLPLHETFAQLPALGFESVRR